MNTVPCMNHRENKFVIPESSLTEASHRASVSQYHSELLSIDMLCTGTIFLRNTAIVLFEVYTHVKDNHF